MDDRIGTQLGNYRLLHLLGQGGFADVYLSEHIHLHTQAAIKVLQLRLIESNVQNFLNEARTIAHLVHPYIIRVLDFGVQDNVPFLVMDYAPKGTFRQRFLNGQRLRPTPLFPYIKQAAAALQYAHDKKLVHRDVKPENMLLGPNDEVLLSDFGFALIQSSTSRTSMETAGTAAYMAPEQLQGRPRPASDQYALGVIAYEWLTGSCPFQGTFFEIASQHMLAAPSPLRGKVPSLSPEIEHVIMTVLAKDPDQRFPTVRDFAIALERACLLAKPIRLDEPLVPPPFLTEPYRPLTTKPASQQIGAVFPSAPAREKSPTRDAAHYPFEPLSSTAFQSITAHGGTLMKPPSFNDQTHLAPQIGQTRPDAIRIPVDQPGNAMLSSQVDTQMRAKSTETNPPMHNLSPSGIQPLSAGQFTQDGTPLMAQHKPSQSMLPSWPPPEQVSQPSPRSLSQQRNSHSGIRPLSADQISQRDQNSLIVSATMTSNIQPSLSQNHIQQPTQSQLDYTPDFSPNRTQLSPMTNQQPAQGQRGATFRDDVQRYRRQETPTSMIIFVVVMAIFIIGGGGGLIYWSNNNPPTPSTVHGLNESVPSQDQVSLTATASSSLNATGAANATATAVANMNPYIPGASTLAMNDPLSSNNQSSQWQVDAQGNCQFTSGSYHALAAPNLFTTCFATATNYTNFTYEIQMVFIQNAPKYSSGGIVFRGNSDQHQYYFFEVYASGRYAFQKCDKTGHCTILVGSPLDPPSPEYHLGQANTLAVVANQNTFTFYINRHPIGSQQTDSSSPYTQGMIGVLARGGLPPAPPTEVAYSNIKVW